MGVSSNSVIENNLYVKQSIFLSDQLKNLATIEANTINIGDKTLNTVISGDSVVIDADRVVLKLSDSIYGTKNPNELNLTNVSEGTLYFMIETD